MMKNLIDLKFLSPDGVGGTGNDDDNVEVQAPEVLEEEDDDEEEDDEEGEEDQEDGEDDEEDDKEDELELSRVSYKEVKEKFPSFFKDFPSLKHAFFREQQFTELFPTLEDAKKAIEDQQQFQEITEAVIEGDANKFIS